VREKVEGLEKRYVRLLGQPTLGQRFFRELVLRIMKRQVKLAERGLTEMATDPPARWTYYAPGDETPPRSVLRTRKRPSRLQFLAKPIKLVANL
jgi:hypothetical protein